MPKGLLVCQTVICPFKTAFILSLMLNWFDSSSLLVYEKHWVHKVINMK